MTTVTVKPSIDAGVLLEAGTNEVEVLVFRVGTQRFGVNVAKVREVRPVEAVTHMPDYPDSVAGVISVRKHVVPLVDLNKYLWGKEGNSDTASTDLLLEYNNRMTAFRVQGIERIFRVSWKALIPLPECPGLSAPVTGVLLLDGDIVALLDFESIGAVLGVNGDARTFMNAKAHPPLTKTDVPLVFVDDSNLIRKMLSDALEQAGYTNWTRIAVQDNINILTAKYWVTQHEMGLLADAVQSPDDVPGAPAGEYKPLMFRCAIDGREYPVSETKAITIFKGNESLLLALRAELSKEPIPPENES